jgi:hypothetical protein
VILFERCHPTVPWTVKLKAPGAVVQRGESLFHIHTNHKILFVFPPWNTILMRLTSRFKCPSLQLYAKEILTPHALAFVGAISYTYPDNGKVYILQQKMAVLFVRPHASQWTCHFGFSC